MDPKKLINLIAQIIYDKKGFNILALDVTEQSSLTNYLIIAEGNVDRHIKAITDEIINELKKIKEKPLYVEGFSEGDWIIIDYFNIMVHLFKPHMREKYNIEKLFEDAKIIDLNIKIENLIN